MVSCLSGPQEASSLILKDWVSISLALPLGTSRRIHCHICGHRDKTLSLTNRGKVHSAHCFACGWVDTQKQPPMTPQERLALAKAAEAFEAEPPTLPKDFTLDMDIHGVLWISKGGLHVDDAEGFGWGWSDKMKRVVMPVYEKGSLVAVQARSVISGMKPKYLSQIHSGPRPAFKAGTRNVGQLVLTEDMLSAARVSKVMDAWSLLGTNLMDAVINQIANTNYTQVLIWMDNDTAGFKARRKMLKQLGAVGIDARIIKAEKDPKYYTLEQIEDILQ